MQSAITDFAAVVLLLHSIPSRLHFWGSGSHVGYNQQKASSGLLTFDLPHKVSAQRYSREKLGTKSKLNSTTGLSDPGEGGCVQGLPQILYDHFTLSQPGSADYAYHSTALSPEFFRTSYGPVLLHSVTKFIPQAVRLLPRSVLDRVCQAKEKECLL